ncbi:MAG TPA: DUF3786 domain-containing protein [Nitrospirae bacterium]|nr:hypothetical protein BMS3Abin09_01098 [bacterium BMS3Abin09]GBE40941.1 hypothetical protein BMS3Bbin09_00828 [bacterium BMS3Bbin09]HDO25477.1 DUF3786 domain-containing protein [Nitrospirota bacterium]HDO66723.1 DUF3786 domain-containing protein [Nitrospirota bacterium]HEW80897.1 DUF3786 domain-containing protein [Nitrospirota bacterium]
MIWPGEEKAWDLLAKLNPKSTETRTGVTFNSESSMYELKCLAQDIHISLKDREITASSETGKFIVNDLGEYSRLPILSYLLTAKDLPLSGELVRPADLSGGGIFVRGTHVLPLDEIAETFGHDHELFLSIGKTLGASVLDYGDVSLELSAFPRIPVILIVWAGDDDFPAKVSLLFDSTCTLQLPIDILWSTAMMTVLTVLKFNSAIEQ